MGIGLLAQSFFDHGIHRNHAYAAALQHFGNIKRSAARLAAIGHADNSNKRRSLGYIQRFLIIQGHENYFALNSAIQTCTGSVKALNSATFLLMASTDAGD